MLTPIRFINCLILGIVCMLPVKTIAEEQTVRAGAWDVTLPLQMSRRSLWDSRNYKKEIDGPFHTLIFSVFDAKSFDWGEAQHRAPADKNRVIAAILSGVLLSMKQQFQISDERNTLASIDRVSGTSLPSHSFCSGYRWRAIDKGVPGHEGKAFTMLGYTVICIDYVENGDKYDVVHIGFSERNCDELGHTPLPDFDNMAEKLFRSMRYRKGPGHNATRGVPGKEHIGSTEPPTAVDIGQLDFALSNEPVRCSG